MATLFKQNILSEVPGNGSSGLKFFSINVWNRTLNIVGNSKHISNNFKG